jgi:Asp-tRNA(Asn)/Glu-tRNA(Gln) amidotransferase A subunit family amidase
VALFTSYIARHGGWLEKYRHILKPEIVQNTEFGLKLSAPDVVAAQIAQGDIVRRVAAFMKDYDALVCPTVLCALRRKPALIPSS